MLTGITKAHCAITILRIEVFTFCVCMCTTWMKYPQGAKKMESDPLELELQVALTAQNVGIGIGT